MTVVIPIDLYKSSSYDTSTMKMVPLWIIAIAGVAKAADLAQYALTSVSLESS